MIKKIKIIIKRKKSSLFYIKKLLDSSISNEEKIWFSYKLGLYNKVVLYKIDKYTEKVYLANLISKVKLGNIKESRLLLKNYDKYIKNKQALIELVQELLPIYPCEIYNILKKHNILPLHYLALLIKFNKNESIEFLKKEINNKSYRKEPQILLLYSNVTGNSITLFNKFLIQYGLKKVKLKNKNNRFSISNLTHNYKFINRNNKPLVTIIMTTYNSENTVKYSIESILEQTYQNFELIIVNDNSKDNTLNILKEYKKIDSRIKVINLEENCGTYVAKNYALSIAKGDYITFHDSDDYSHPQKLEIQLNEILKDKRKVASISYWVRIDEDSKYRTRHIYPYLRLNLSSLMITKKVIEKIGFFDQVRTGADSEYFERIKLVFGDKSIKTIKKPLSLGAYRKDSLMTSKDTGYNEYGISEDRQKYWENWRLWHIKNIKQKTIPYISLIQKERLFKANKNIIVESEKIIRVYKKLKDE